MIRARHFPLRVPAEMGSARLEGVIAVC